MSKIKHATEELIKFLDEEIKYNHKDIMSDFERGFIDLTDHEILTHEKDIVMFIEIKAIVEDYPIIKAMLNEFISQEVDEYKHMRHEDVDRFVDEGPDRMEEGDK